VRLRNDRLPLGDGLHRRDRIRRGDLFDRLAERTRVGPRLAVEEAHHEIRRKGSAEKHHQANDAPIHPGRSIRPSRKPAPHSDSVTHSGHADTRSAGPE